MKKKLMSMRNRPNQKIKVKNSKRITRAQATMNFNIVEKERIAKQALAQIEAVSKRNEIVRAV